MLCDIETIEDAVDYLNKRFPGIIKVEMGKDYWTVDGGFVAENRENENLEKESGSPQQDQVNSG